LGSPAKWATSLRPVGKPDQSGENYQNNRNSSNCYQQSVTNVDFTEFRRLKIAIQNHSTIARDCGAIAAPSLVTRLKALVAAKR
jgi:hypothetical protein